MPHSVLTEEQVLEIKRLKRPGVGATKIAKLLGLTDISLHTINGVLRGDTWQHVKVSDDFERQGGDSVTGE